MNKRAISPLIATLLLIAFSVGLGAVVMSYGETYVEENSEFVSGAPEVSPAVCDAVDFQIISVGGEGQICSREGMIELAVDNGPQMAIDGIQARVVGDLDVDISPNILIESLGPAESLKTIFEHSDVGTPLQVRLTPLLRDGQVTYCADKALVVENLVPC